MDFVLLGFVGDDGAHALRCHALGVEAVAHGKTRAEQADGVQALLFDGFGGGIHNMQQRNANGVFYGGGDFVHGVGGQQQQICACACQFGCAVCQQMPCGCPIALLLQLHHGFKIDAVHDDFCAAVAA